MSRQTTDIMVLCTGNMSHNVQGAGLINNLLRLLLRVNNSTMAMGTVYMLRNSLKIQT